MNKQELVKKMAEKSGLTNKDAEKAVNAFVETVEEELMNQGRVQLIGFGTFETANRKAKKGRNPRKPDEVIEIPAATVPKFKAGKVLKDKVNKK